MLVAGQWWGGMGLWVRMLIGGVVVVVGWCGRGGHTMRIEHGRECGHVCAHTCVEVTKGDDAVAGWGGI